MAQLGRIDGSASQKPIHAVPLLSGGKKLRRPAGLIEQNPDISSVYVLT
jgi:hypothetical protein